MKLASGSGIRALSIKLGYLELKYESLQDHNEEFYADAIDKIRLP
jgi:hypothetical protein